VVTREYLIEMFKLYAINRLHLDEKKFEQVVRKMVGSNEGLIDKFINANKGAFLKKKRFKASEPSRKSMDKSLGPRG
jgi:hypothetical protein